MIAKSIDGSELEIRILSYEFEEIKEDIHSSNFLMIYVRVKSPRASWDFTGAYLLTWEIFSIAEWLKALANNDTSKNKQDFIERNLRFRLVNKLERHTNIRVYFYQEGRPPQVTINGALKKRFPIDFTFADAELVLASDLMLAELNMFPMRRTDKRIMPQPPYI